MAQKAQQQIYLEVESLSKTYKSVSAGFGFGKKRQEVQALKNVSFCLRPGLYGLLGPNGAGKSTLINIIVGTIKQDKGKVLWGGKPAAALGAQFRRQLGYMPQQQTLYETYTGRRFLSYIAALKELPKNRVPQEVARVAACVNLTQELGKPLGAYSGGMKQRLLAAAALMGTPSLLVMDEPTAGLDPKERVHLRNLLAQTAKQSIVLVATHVVPDVESVADEILILKDGRLVDMAPPAQLVQKYAPDQNLEAVYLSIFGPEDV